MAFLAYMTLIKLRQPAKLFDGVLYQFCSDAELTGPCFEQQTPSRASTAYNLTLYHKPCWCRAQVSCAWGVCVCVSEWVCVCVCLYPVFLSDSADDGLPVPVFWNKPTASKPSTTYDLPLYHNLC
jgi:hypothetical protein